MHALMRGRNYSPSILSLAMEMISAAHLLHIVLFFLLSSHLFLFSLFCASLYCSPSYPPLRVGEQKNLFFFHPPFSQAPSLASPFAMLVSTHLLLKHVAKESPSCPCPHHQKREERGWRRQKSREEREERGCKFFLFLEVLFGHDHHFKIHESTRADLDSEMKNYVCQCFFVCLYHWLARSKEGTN